MTINLTPPQTKRERQGRQIFGQIIFGLAVILIMLGIMSAGLYVYDMMLASDLKKTNDRIASQDKRLKEYKVLDDSIKSVNLKLDQIESVHNNRFIWSEICQRIADNMPKGVQIKGLNLNGNTNVIVLSGVALSRQDIAVFKEKLEQNSFNNVTFSSSTYNDSANNYSFSLTFEPGGKK